MLVDFLMEEEEVGRGAQYGAWVCKQARHQLHDGINEISLGRRELQSGLSGKWQADFHALITLSPLGLLAKCCQICSGSLFFVLHALLLFF